MAGASQLNREGTAGQRYGHRIDVSVLAQEMFGMLCALGSRGESHLRTVLTYRAGRGIGRELTDNYRH